MFPEISSAWLIAIIIRDGIQSIVGDAVFSQRIHQHFFVGMCASGCWIAASGWIDIAECLAKHFRFHAECRRDECDGPPVIAGIGLITTGKRDVAR